MRHVAASSVIGEDLTLFDLVGHFLAEIPHGRGMIGEGVEQPRGFLPITEPKPVVPVERTTLGPDADPSAIFDDPALDFVCFQHLERPKHQRVIFGKNAPGVDALAERPLASGGILGYSRSHYRRDIAVPLPVGLGIARDCLLEDLIEIDVFFLPGLGVFGLSKPPRRFHSRLHTGEQPVIVSELRRKTYSPIPKALGT